MTHRDTVKLNLWRMPWIPGHADAGGVCDDQLMGTMADRSVYNKAARPRPPPYRGGPKKRQKKGPGPGRWKRLRKQGVTQELGEDEQAAFAAELGLPAAHAS